MFLKTGLISSMLTYNMFICVIALIIISSKVGASEKIEEKRILKEFSLHLDASRIIYSDNSVGETISVINKHDYPILVQSSVMKENQQDLAPFIMTPPLFRLDPHQSSRIRIVRVGGEFPSDRETLQWVCVKGIPPKNEDKWAEGWYGKNKSNIALEVNFSVNSCIKLMFRPDSIKGYPENIADKIKWKRSGNLLKGENPTPFYMNISEINIGGVELNDNHYIAPFSSYEYKIPLGVVGKIKWRVKNDYGGSSKIFESDYE
ncbi:fimbria/pilus periplasmic chaperone [Escherichia coli]|uniref:fimbria/pilus periplasmic chaperone n=1 Tax=Escherichia coli TaxID=562 RepID=UPI0029811CB6|nr:fimbria/pilus periplasmic chaperone [Escherichia coli]